MNTKDVLVKLGMAIYIHKEMIKRAQKGKEAVEYLREKGIFYEKNRVLHNSCQEI